MKAKKVYGIHGLLEWHGTVESNGVKMKVDFTNGSVTGYGVAPATFSTSDTLTQYIMESSDQFKGGRIKIIQVIPLPDDKKESEAASEEAPEEPAADVQSVQVANKMEAVEYLKEHFPGKNYTAFTLRGKAAFESACKECGVEFVFS